MYNVNGSPFVILPQVITLRLLYLSKALHQKPSTVRTNLADVINILYNANAIHGEITIFQGDEYMKKAYANREKHNVSLY